MPPEYIATIAVAALALVGTCVTAIFQYRATVNTRKSKELEEAKQRAEAAEKALEKEKQDRQFAELQSQIQSLSSSLEDTRNEIKYVGDRLDKYKKVTDKELEEQGESIQKIIDVLSKNAHMYSGIMHMHAQTESRMQALMDVQTYNMKFANETATTLRIIGELVSHAMGNNPQDAERLQDALTASSTTHKEFIDNILGAQQHFFKDSAPESDNMMESETLSEKVHDKIDT